LNSCVQSMGENVGRQHFSYNFFIFFLKKGLDNIAPMW
jgi:hypothetical protein